MLPFANLISIDIRAERPIYLQLADQLIVHIQKGVIPQSYKLPSTRQMGEILRLNRQTIVSAYEEVANQGWIESIPYKGTFVRVDLPIIMAQQWNDNPKPTPSNDTQINTPKSYKYIINRGSPDERLVPIDALARAYRNALKASIKSRHLINVDYQQNLQNETIVANYLNSTRGLTTHAAEIILTNGSQMGIYLAAQIILNKGDTIAVGKTSYLGADTIFIDKGAKLALFEVDNQGINVDQIEEYCKKNKLRCVYITPHHHLPTTVTLSAARRMRLLEIANKYDFYIIEDDYDYDFHYKGSPILPLASADDQCRVIYVGSMSKILAPGIRFGYLAAGTEIVTQMKKHRKNIDRHNDLITSKAICSLIREGEIDRHIRKSLAIYRQRRKQFCDVLLSDFQGIITFQKPKGGLAVWANFDQKYDLTLIAARAKKKGLIFPSSSVYDREGLLHNSTRMGFASLNENEIIEALKILRSVID